MSQIISLILCDSESEIKATESKKIFDRIIYVDEKDPDNKTDAIKDFIEMSSPRIVKTHLPFYLSKNWFESDAKIAVILRNPKDTLVALYHFFKGYLRKSLSMQ